MGHEAGLAEDVTAAGEVEGRHGGGAGLLEAAVVEGWHCHCHKGGRERGGEESRARRAVLSGITAWPGLAWPKGERAPFGPSRSPGPLPASQADGQNHL